MSLPFFGHTWTPKEMPDLSGSVAIVTGGAVGCGYEICKELLLHNATVIIATRSESKAQAAIRSLHAAVGQKAKVYFIRVDLGQLSTVQPFVEQFMKTFNKLDLLINNAGVMTPPYGSKTVDGDELQFGTNVLGHFAVTKALYPLMHFTASRGAQVRIVWVSSSAFKLAPKPPIQYDDLQMSKLGPSLANDFIRYGQSKAGNVLLALYGQKLWSHENIISVFVHPGLIQTELQRHNESIVIKVARRFVFKPASYGAINALYAATSPKIKGGEYVAPWATVQKARSDLYDLREQEKLWDFCEKEMTKRSVLVH